MDQPTENLSYGQLVSSIDAYPVVENQHQVLSSQEEAITANETVQSICHYPLINQVSEEFQHEENSEGRNSDYDEFENPVEADDPDDEEEAHETEDEEMDKDMYDDHLIEDEDEDHQEEDDDGDDDDDDEEEDDEDEDDSSHHSDSSSADGHRSQSPMWPSYPRTTSVFSRLNLSQNSTSLASDVSTIDSISLTTRPADLINSSLPLVSNGNDSTLTSVSSSSSSISRTSILSGRRPIQSVISLLSTSSSNPTLVITSSGANTINTVASSDTVSTTSHFTNSGPLVCYV